MEGSLKVKDEDQCGWRHYIEAPGGAHDDLHCGSALQVAIGKWVDVPGGQKFVADRWLTGRYEADLCYPNPKAFLVLGELYPNGDQILLPIPIGTKVRRPEEGVQ